MHIQEETYYESKNGKVGYHPKRNAILLHIKGFMKSEEYQQAFLKSLECAQKKNARVWISDFSGLVGQKPEDLDWTLNEWYPKWFTRQFDEVAIVEPEQVFGKLSLKKLLTRDLFSRYNVQCYLNYSSLLEKHFLN